MPALLTNALTVTGSGAANVITTGSGADTIHGGGGADIISAGAGDDVVDYHGAELSIDGGAGVNTLAMKAAGTINLANTSDQSSGDTAVVTISRT